MATSEHAPTTPAQTDITGGKPVRRNTCKTETNTAILMNAQIWNICIVITTCVTDIGIGLTTTHP